MKNFFKFIIYILGLSATTYASMLETRALEEEKVRPDVSSSMTTRSRVQDVLQRESLALNSFGVLPNELKLHVFSYLRIADALRATFVSREWCTLLKDFKLWKHYASRYMTVDDTENEEVLSAAQLTSSVTAISFYKERLKSYFTRTVTLLDTNDFTIMTRITSMSASGFTMVGNYSISTSEESKPIKRALLYREDRGLIPFFDYLKTLKNSEEIVRGIQDIETIDLISGDATTMVGRLIDRDNQPRLYVYRKGNGFNFLKTDEDIEAYKFTGISTDGTKIVGTRSQPSRSFYILPPSNEIHYFTLPENAYSIYVRAISADGTKIAGGVSYHDGNALNLRSPFKPFVAKFNSNPLLAATIINLSEQYGEGTGASLSKDGHRLLINGTLKEGYPEKKIYPLVYSNPEETARELYPKAEGEGHALAISADDSTILVSKKSYKVDGEELSSVPHLYRGSEVIPIYNLLPEEIISHDGVFSSYNIGNPCMNHNGVIVSGQSVYHVRDENGELFIRHKSWRVSIPRKDWLINEGFMQPEEPKEETLPPEKENLWGLIKRELSTIPWLPRLT